MPSLKILVVSRDANVEEFWKSVADIGNITGNGQFLFLYMAMVCLNGFFLLGARS